MYKQRSYTQSKRAIQKLQAQNQLKNAFYYQKTPQYWFSAANPAPLDAYFQDKNQMQKIFQNDSTYQLIKKLFVYKLMGSNIFINNASAAMATCYRLLGVKITNMLIHMTVGGLFTAGETLQTLKRQEDELLKQNTFAIANYVAEGTKTMDYSQIEKFNTELNQIIDYISKDKAESHKAFKVTALISIELISKLSHAQKIYTEKILKFEQAESISEQEIRESLAEVGVTDYTEQEFNDLMTSLKFKDNETDRITLLETYANGHLFFLDPKQRLSLQHKIQKALGITNEDLEHFDKFSQKLINIGQKAYDQNCYLYVDAEQTYVQRAIDSFAQQLTFRYNVNGKSVIMNGFQCYLKRTARTIPYEYQASRKLGYNLGIKLIRGAYMNEERMLAREYGYESPVWDTIEDTHTCYDNLMTFLIQNIREGEGLFVASHNMESVSKAMRMMRDQGITDKRVRFGQLKGFSDQLTSILAREGFTVYKYLPFGPTELIMPYLIRRGEESKQVLREQQFQNEFLKGEILRRFRLRS